VEPEGTDRFEAGVVEAPGAEEAVVVPWPLLLRQRVSGRVERSDRARWFVLATVLTGQFAVGVTITVLTISLPRVARELHSDTNTLTWVITGPLLAFGVIGPLLGKVSDLWGPRRVYLLGLAGSVVFATSSAVAWSAGALIACRVLAGAEGATVGPSGMALILHAFPKEDRVKAMGWWSLVGAGAPVLGVVIGGPLVEAVGWRVIFAAQAPIALGALLVGSIVLPRTPSPAGDGERPPVDLAGACALAVAVTSVLFALNRAPEWGWGSAAVVVAFALAPIAAVAFVAVERRAAHPLIPLDYLRRRNFALPIGVQFFTNFAYMGSFFLTPLFLARAFHYGETHIGTLSIARPLTFSLSAPIAGYVAVRVGERAAAIVGAAAVVASMAVWSHLGPASADVAVMGALALAGVGLGVSSPSMASTVANAVDEDSFGIAGAAQQLVVQVGVVAGIQITETYQAARQSSVGLVTSFQQAYLLAGLVCLAGVACAVFVRSADRATSPAGAVLEGVSPL
jgi:EmrB/QacA subfamily drug resistance transporter